MNTISQLMAWGLKGLTPSAGEMLFNTIHYLRFHVVGAGLKVTPDTDTTKWDLSAGDAVVNGVYLEVGALDAQTGPGNSKKGVIQLSEQGIAEFYESDTYEAEEGKLKLAQIDTDASGNITADNTKRPVCPSY
jgi:hypothetical protein